MARWHAFFDDSAGEAGILNLDFTPKPIKPMRPFTNPEDAKPPKGCVTPVYAAGGILVRGSALYAVERDLLQLRREAAQHLGSTDLPIIHMRHLWGRENQTHDDDGRNPFSSLPEHVRFDLARKALTIIHRHCSDRTIYVLEGSLDIPTNQRLARPYYDQPRVHIERDFIFSGIGSKHAKKFYNRILNPLVGVLCDFILEIDQFCDEGHHEATICYDKSEASKGFETPELYTALHEIDYGQHIREASHSNTVNTELLQLADIASWLSFRHGLDIHRGGDPDPEVLRLRRGLKIYNLDGRLRDPHKQWEGMAAHYVVALQYLRERNAAWTAANLYSPLELLGRMQEMYEQKKPGVFLVRDEVLPG